MPREKKETTDEESERETSRISWTRETHVMRSVPYFVEKGQEEGNRTGMMFEPKKILCVVTFLPRTHPSCICHRMDRT